MVHEGIQGLSQLQFPLHPGSCGHWAHTVVGGHFGLVCRVTVIGVRFLRLRLRPQLNVIIADLKADIKSDVKTN
jgi:hypothetical protein